MNWQSVPGNIQTAWVKDISPENPWPEYPRPQLVRSDWVNLNGLWDFWISDKTDAKKHKREGKILVPFSIESALSGVRHPLAPDELLWYRREFSVPVEWRTQRILLHFGAVDWESRVFINGKEAGGHTGGYLPFSLDITNFLNKAEGSNELVISVWDPTDTHWQQRGKQVLKPKSIWYTAVSGIWQTVWLEAVPQTYITGLRVIPDVDAGMAHVEVNLTGPDSGNCEPLIQVYDGGALIGQAAKVNSGRVVSIPIPAAKLWSPSSPHLYDLVVTAGEDQVGSYIGMRKFSLEAGRLCLNGSPLFQFGPLDQGYWPDGLYTPPSDEAMRKDIELVKELGFNMLRKHVKVEPARYYYYCDRIGLIVWQDMPNGGKSIGDTTSVMAMIFGSRRKDRNYRYAGRVEEASRQDFRRELQDMVDHLHNFPCIGMWVPFNEGWGQFDANAIAQWLTEYDPTRLVDHASGWFDQGGGHCKSIHMYKLKLPLIRPERNRAVVLSEFGGYSLKVDGHLWKPEAEFGYKTFTTTQDITKAYLDLLIWQLKPWIDAGLSAAIYTQTTDVEIEVNGFVTYDRAVEKMDFSRIRQAHQELIQPNTGMQRIGN
jgi:beta-galactosidase/beta-glucuronidase